MIGFIVKKFIGSKNEREVKRLRPMVAKINAFEDELQKLSDDTLRQKTAAWKEELSSIEDDVELARRLTEILPEAFAVVKNCVGSTRRKIRPAGFRLTQRLNVAPRHAYSGRCSCPPRPLTARSA